MQHKSIKSVGSYEYACKKLWLRNQNAQPKIPFATENLETFCISEQAVTFDQNKHKYTYHCFTGSKPVLVIITQKLVEEIYGLQINKEIKLEPRTTDPS